MINRIKNLINKLVRPLYLHRRRKAFRNNTLSVFSSNCVGGCMLHDLGVRFNSPFVNLYLSAEDFLKFLSDPHKYNNLKFRKLSTEQSYPVAAWGDLTIHFVHYNNFEEAVNTFKKRLSRVNYDNLFIIFSERDGCTNDCLMRFDRLPYKNKIVFTHLPYENIASAFYIEGYEHESQLGDILKWDKRIGRKIYDRFDYAQWLNG